MAVRKLKTALYGALALAGLCVLPALAGDPSALNGTWINRGKSHAQIRISVAAHGVTLHTRKGPLLYPTDGSVRTLSVRGGGVRAQARWSGSVLVVETETKPGGRPVVETWELTDADTLTITRRVRKESGRLGVPLKRHYRRQR